MIKMTVPGPFTMSQQAQNDFYTDDEEMALDYAAAVNAEIKDLFAAGADVVQIDEPYMQARPDKARKFGLKALNAALDGVTGTTAVHICFGYAAIIHVRPEGYSFLPEFANSPVKQISIETAQSKLDCAVLEKLPGKTILLGVLDLSDMAIETPEMVAARIRRALPHHPAEQHHRRAGLRAEIPAARCRVRQDAGDGRRRGDRAAGTGAVDGRRAARAKCRHELRTSPPNARPSSRISNAPCMATATRRTRCTICPRPESRCWCATTSPA